MLLAFALIGALPQAVRGDDDPRSGPKVQAADPTSESGFAAEIRRTLKTQHDRMTDLANQLVGSAELPPDLEGQLAAQQIKVESAKAALQSAVLGREVAEMAVAEYEQGIFVQEKADLDAELKLARSERERARSQIAITKFRLAQIQQKSTGSSSDLASEFRSSNLVTSAQFSERAASFKVTTAEAKLKVLLEFTKGQRTKQLQTDIERARSDELYTRATWELEQAKCVKLQRMIRDRDLPERKARDLLDRQPLVWLDRATPIEEQIRNKLEQLDKAAKPDDPLRKEIQGLTNQLRALVDQAEIARSGAQFDTLKTRIQAAANR